MYKNNARSRLFHKKAKRSIAGVELATSIMTIMIIQMNISYARTDHRDLPLSQPIFARIVVIVVKRTHFAK